MTKIIKKGRSVKVIYIGTCRECDCIFECGYRDLHSHWKSLNKGNIGVSSCPGCGFRDVNMLPTLRKIKKP